MDLGRQATSEGADEGKKSKNNGVDSSSYLLAQCDFTYTCVCCTRGVRSVVLFFLGPFVMETIYKAR